MAVNSTITIKGKTYTVTWAADQSGTGKSYVMTKQNWAKMEWSKPVVRDSRNKVVPGTFIYDLYIETPGMSTSAAARLRNVLTWTGNFSSDTNFSAHQVVGTVIAKFTPTGVTGSGSQATIGEAKLFSQWVYPSHDTSIVARLTPGSNGRYGGRLILSSALDIYSYGEGNVEDTFAYLSSIDDIRSRLHAIVQYRLFDPVNPNAPWVNYTQTDTTTGMRIVKSPQFEASNYISKEKTSIELKHNVILSPDSIEINKVYEVRVAISNSVLGYVDGRSDLLIDPSNGAPAWLEGSPIDETVLLKNAQWVTKKIMMKPKFDNIIGVGDEILTGESPTTTVMDFVAASESQGGSNTSNFNSTFTSRAHLKTGAKVADIPALFRSIPTQLTSKRTLVVVNVGMHDVLNVAPSKMVSSTIFKATLKAAILAFILKNPNAVVALSSPAIFNKPSSTSTDRMITEVKALDTAAESTARIDAYNALLVDSQYSTASTTKAPNIWGTSNSSVKAAATVKLESYAVAIRQIVEEFAAKYPDNKRVIMLNPLEDPARGILDYERYPLTLANFNVPTYVFIGTESEDLAGIKDKLASDKFRLNTANTAYSLIYGVNHYQTFDIGDKISYLSSIAKIADVIY